jgi:hypothetical protein
MLGTLHRLLANMNTETNHVEIVNRFAGIANRFCSVVDSAPKIERADLLFQIYRILPKVIDEAISVPDVTPSDSNDGIDGTSQVPVRTKHRQSLEEWSQLYNLLKEKLVDWDSYRQVFDPTRDNEAIFGTLADDLADIYRNLKEGIVASESHRARPEDVIWSWRFSFYSHWGKHAMDALLAIHFRLQNAGLL